MTSSPSSRKQKVQRYAAAYGWFFLLALIGMAVTWNIRANVLAITWLAGTSPEMLYRSYKYGTLVLFLPFIVFVALLEPYVNKAARLDEVWLKVKKILLIEGGVGALSLVISIVTALLLHVPFWVTY